MPYRFQFLSRHSHQVLRVEQDGVSRRHLVLDAEGVVGVDDVTGRHGTSLGQLHQVEAPLAGAKQRGLFKLVNNLGWNYLKKVVARRIVFLSGFFLLCLNVLLGLRRVSTSLESCKMSVRARKTDSTERRQKHFFERTWKFEVAVWWCMIIDVEEGHYYRPDFVDSSIQHFS